LIIEALRASYLLTSKGKDEIIQSRDRMHLKGACFLSRQWGDLHIYQLKASPLGRNIDIILWMVL